MEAQKEYLPMPLDSSFRWFERVENRFNYHWHVHPEYELTYIKKGRGRRFVGDHMGAFVPGDLVLLGENLPHTWCSEEERYRGGDRSQQAWVIHFDQHLLGQGFLEKPEFTHIRKLLERSSRGLLFDGLVPQDIQKRLVKVKRSQGLTSLMELLQLLAFIAEADSGHVLASTGFSPSLREGDSCRIDTVCRFMNEQYQQPIKVEEAARMVYMAPSTFSRFFKRNTGRTFVEYLNHIRIGQACLLLIQTDQSIIEICYQTGFRNIAHFNRMFRRLKGMAPRTYRRAHEQGSPP